MSAEPPASLHRTHWAVQLLAGAGLLAIIGFALALILLFGAGLDRPDRPSTVAGQKHKIVLTVGEPQRLRGTPWLEMNISASGGGLGSGGYSGRSEDVRNILLVDSQTGASRRLLPDNAHRVAESSFYPAKADSDEADTGDRTMGGDQQQKEASPAYYVIQLRRAGDPEREDLPVGTLATGRQKVVMPGIEGVDKGWMVSPTRIGFLVRQQLVLYYRVVDIPSLRVIQSRSIAID